MSVKPLRRLIVPTTRSLYERLSAEALSCAWSRPEIDALDRQHPELVLARDGNTLGAFDEGLVRLAYAFRSDGAFTDHFPSMFEKLLPRCLQRKQKTQTSRPKSVFR